MEGNFWDKDEERGNDNQEDQKGKSKGDSSWMLLIVGGLLVFAILWALLGNVSSTNTTISYTEFRSQVRDGNVSEVTLSDERVQGHLQKPIPYQIASGETVQVNDFVTQLPAMQDPTLIPLLEDNEVTVNVSPPQPFSWAGMVFNLLPLVILIGLSVYLFRRFAAQSEGTTNSLTKSKAKLFDRAKSRTTFADVAGASGAKQELEEVIQYLREPERFQRLGASIPKGVLLIGPPGTGKTLLARAVAGEAQAPFFSIGGSDFMEIFVGVGASRVRSLFEEAKKNSPAIVFIDELDSIGRRRGSGVGGGNEEREQTLNQLLSEMDGFEANEHVIVMAATNRADILDPALRRPGRFDRQVVVDTPTSAERIEILKIHARNKPFADDVDLEAIARGTPGFSGADLANLLNEAALLAARQNKDQIAAEELSEARDKIMMGLERNVVMTPEEARLVAYHESGHAIVAALLPNADPIHKVTIIPRGQAMGVTQQLPERDRYLYPREYLIDYMAVMMGGRAAEELALQTATSGAESDLRQATRLARKMVVDWGMSERVGRVALGGDGYGYLGEEFGSKREFSETTAREIDEEVKRLLDEAYGLAQQILSEHRPGMERVVEALIDKEQISGKELELLLAE